MMAENLDLKTEAEHLIEENSILETPSSSHGQGYLKTKINEKQLVLFPYQNEQNKKGRAFEFKSSIPEENGEVSSPVESEGKQPSEKRNFQFPILSRENIEKDNIQLKSFREDSPLQKNSHNLSNQTQFVESKDPKIEKSLNFTKNGNENLLKLVSNNQHQTKYSIKVLNSSSSQRDCEQLSHMENGSGDQALEQNNRKFDVIMSLDDVSKGVTEEDYDNENRSLTGNIQNDNSNPQNKKPFSNDNQYLTLPKANSMKLGHEKKN